MSLMSSRSARLTLSIIVAIAALLVTLPSATANPPTPQRYSSTAKPIIVILDTSGSMSSDDGNGVIKLDGAKRAVNQLLAEQPPGAELGIWTYPGSSGSCSPGGYLPGAELRHLDSPTNLSATVAGLTADGSTPTAEALQGAADDLRSRGETGATFVLVSDGESTCDNPCDTAKSLAAEGFDITVRTMGFRISEAGRKELECIADATQGAYYDAQDSGQLSDELSKLSVPSLSLDVKAPTAAPSGGQVVLSAEVSNPSAVAIDDAWVGLQFTGGTNHQGLLPAVIPPRFRLGRLAPRSSKAVRSWTVSTGLAGTGARMNWTVSAWGATTRPELETGTITITEKLDPSRGGVVLRDILNSPASAIVMGDSYSSGEGTRDYYSADKDYAAECHRSDLQYASQLLATAKHPKVRNIACSGAVVADLISAQFLPDDDGIQYKTSRGQLATLASQDAPSAVFLTLGGNDIHFADLARMCILSTNCTTNKDLDTMVSTGIQSLSSLSKYYTEIYRIINTDDKRAARGGQAAPVIVLPYPKVLPQAAGAACTDLSAEEVGYINEKERQLNAAIHRAQSEAWKQGAEVYYASDVMNATQPDHTMCDKESYINRADLAMGVGAGIADYRADKAGMIGGTSPELAHPNVRGHGAEAAGIITWSTTVTARPGYRDVPKYFANLGGAPDRTVADNIDAATELHDDAVNAGSVDSAPWSGGLRIG